MTDMYSRHGATPVSSRRLSGVWTIPPALPSALPSSVAARLRFSDSSMRSCSTIQVRGSEESRETPPAPAPLASKTKDG